jgi:PAS domain S-box-containing protein
MNHRDPTGEQPQPGVRSNGAAGASPWVPVGGGEMGARVRAFNWSATALGPFEQWPPSLRNAVGICLSSSFPMFVWWGPDLINIYNDAYAPVLGKRHPAALGGAARVIWHEIWPAIGDEIEGVISRGQPVSRERMRLILERNGYPEETFFTYSHSPIPDDHGGIGGLFQVCTDETARVLAERERDKATADLADTRARLERTLTAADVGTWTWDVQKNSVVADRNLAFLFGVTDQQANGGPLDAYLAAINPDDRPQAERRIAEAMASGDTFEAEYRITGRDGQVRTVIARGAVVRDSAGQPVRLPGVVVDVTQRKRAELQLLRSQARYADILKTSLDAIVTMDHRGIVTDWNPAATVIFGYTAAEALGQEMAELIIPPAMREMHRKGLAHFLATGEGPILNKRIELVSVAKDGQEIPVELTVTVAALADPPEFTAFIRDISRRKHAEAERESLLDSERTARAEAERVSKLKDEFLATLSHEIRTPLNAILGWSQIMRSSKDPADAAQGLDVIERNARAQAQIIEDLLDMSRIISGKVRLDVQRVDLAPVVRAAVDTARPTAEAKGVRLLSVIDPLAQVAVSGDPNRLQQIFWNLLSNAIKFTPKEGRVQVVLERVNSHLEISVSDSGEGIKPEFLPYVFDRFRQADASTTRRHGGLGLGLSIVKQLVELHGGSISAKSDGTGCGSTFIVALPMTVLHADHETETERRHPRASLNGPPDACVELKSVRVLVVDDEADARSLVRRLLEDCHATVTTASSVPEALALLAAGGFDVLVSDIGMPGEDGYSLVRKLRALGRANGGDLPAIALTAYARPEDRVKAITAGFQMHVAKPVEPIELVTMVAAAARRTGR